VELTREGPRGAWGLTFQTRACIVRYHKAADAWKCLNANVLTDPAVVAGRCKAPPSAVTVVPV
jgi:hypothetical protein